MNDSEKHNHLLGVQEAMHEIVTLAERIAGHVNALAEAGMDLPALRQTAATLAEMALGWETNDVPADG